jgi:hypothetical protein
MSDEKPACRYCRREVKLSYPLAWDLGPEGWWCGVCPIGRITTAIHVTASDIDQRWQELKAKPETPPYLLADLNEMLATHLMTEPAD